MLRNMGIPGIILSPKGDDRLSQDEVERVKAYIQSRLTGDQRGQPLAMGSPTDVQQLSFSPQQLDLAKLRSTAEARVPAALGIPSAVVGFQAGLDSSKVGATMHEFVRLAWSNGIVPVQRLMAAELQRVLLPHFEQDADRFLVGWNYDEVSALEADQNALATRYQVLVGAGILKVSEAREALGYESTPDDDIYLRPSSLTPTDPKDQMPEPEPMPALPAAVLPNGHGNGARNGSRNGAVATRALKQGTLDEWVTEMIGRTARRSG